ncbi:MAG: hypothetical protein WC291_00120 [Thermodesulfovibrionales bacterium]|jgi:hypothetical protein
MANGKTPQLEEGEELIGGFEFDPQAQAASEYFKPEAAAQRNIQQGLSGFNTGLRNVVVPALGAAAGVGATGLLLPEAGPLAPIGGAAVGAGVTRGAVAVLDKLFGVPTPPPRWQDYMGDILAAGGGQATATMLEGTLARKAPQLISGAGMTPEQTFLQSGRFTPAAPQPTFELKTQKKPGVLGFRQQELAGIPPWMQHERQAYDLGEQIGAGRPDLMGKSVQMDPSTLTQTLGESIKTQERGMAAAARKKGYNKLDNLLKHPSNIKEPNTMVIGEEKFVGEDGETYTRPIFNPYPIESPFDLKSLAPEFEELKYHAQNIGIKPDSQLMTMLERLTNPKRYIVNLDEAMQQASDLAKYARTDVPGTSNKFKRAAAQALAKFQTAIDETLSGAAVNAKVKPAQAAQWRATGRELWAKKAELFGGAEGRASQKALTSSTVRQLLGSNNSGAVDIIRYTNQTGPAGADALWQAHWRDAVNLATSKSEFNPYVFDQALIRPGGDTLNTLVNKVPNLGGGTGASRPVAMRNASRQIHDYLTSRKEYAGWSKLSNFTKNMISHGDPELRSALDDFYSQMTTLSKGGRAQEAEAKLNAAVAAAAGDEAKAAQGITPEQIASVVARAVTRPGTAGVKGRHVIKGIGYVLGMGDAGSVRNVVNHLKVQGTSAGAVRTGIIGAAQRGVVHLPTAAQRQNFTPEQSGPLEIEGLSVEE